MTYLCIRHILIGVALAFAPGPAAGQTVVYDPSNYAQNVLQAARALQQINNQITSLQNQTQMLLNQVRNLTSLPYSALQTIDQSIVRTQRLLSQAQRLGYDINQIDQAFGLSYPQSYPVSTSSQQLAGDAQSRWENALVAYQDALRVQAGVVQAIETSRSETSGLLSSSQSATGLLQASQAGNQLSALQTRQLLDLNDNEPASPFSRSCRWYSAIADNSASSRPLRPGVWIASACQASRRSSRLPRRSLRSPRRWRRRPQPAKSARV